MDVWTSANELALLRQENARMLAALEAVDKWGRDGLGYAEFPVDTVQIAIAKARDLMRRIEDK